MIPIGTTVQRTNTPNSGRVGVIVGEMIPVVETYLVSFSKGMPQYWSPRYFKVLKMDEPSWEA